MRGSGAGSALAFTAVLGLVVGVVIVGQTLYAVTREHMRELATLKALGASDWEIVGFVAWQAGLLAFVGGGIGLLQSLLVRAGSRGRGSWCSSRPRCWRWASARCCDVRRGEPVERARGAAARGRRGVQVSADALVRAKDVTRSYGEGDLAVPVLHGITLEIRAGELSLLMGPSGSGKTTLLSILAGLLRPTTGDVELCGVPISSLPDAEAARVRRRNLGFVFQTYNLFPALTALDNVAEVLALQGALHR